MGNEDSSRRWRASVVVLTLLLLLAMASEAIVPQATLAKQKKDRGQESSQVADKGLADVNAYLSEGRKGGVDAQIVGGKPVPQGGSPI